MGGPHAGGGQLPDHALTPAPVLVLGGQANAIAIVRSLGRMGIPVHVAARADCLAYLSRYCGDRYPCPEGRDPGEYWTELLLGDTPRALRGSVLFACSDDAIVFIADHYDALRERFRLPEFAPDLQRAMLDKRRTLLLAREAGVPAPRFWDLDASTDLEAMRREITFPAMIKPVHSHLFQRAFPNRKYLAAGDFDELVRGARQMAAHDLAAIVSELIPGADDLACSYYTYIDGRGEPLFHFTKRVFRRFPMNQGGATYHITEWLPEAAELGQRFFRGIGFRGNGMVELKRDPRDHALKLIECNARFAAAQWIFVRAGMDIAYLIYRHVTGQPVPRIDRYRDGVRLWHPLEDYWAFRELREKGLITSWGWLRSVLHRQALPYFTLADPRPGLFLAAQVLRGKLRTKLRTARSRP